MDNREQRLRGERSRFELIEEDQGKEQESNVVTEEILYLAPRSNKRKVAPVELRSTTITDHFTPKKMKTLEEKTVTGEQSFMEQDSWEQLAEDVMLEMELNLQDQWPVIRRIRNRPGVRMNPGSSLLIT